MLRKALCLSVLTLSGCDLVDQGRDLWGGLTNPLVAQGIVLGVEPPQSDEIELDGTGFEEGTGLTLFLADTRSVDDLENAPVTGASVTLEGVTANEETGGTYVILPDGELTYEGGSTWTVSVERDGDAANATVTLPPRAEVDVPATHDPNTAMTLSLAGQDFPSALVVVVEAESGNITYSNEPEGIQELYEFTRGGEPVADVTIPASAFPSETLYAVGVAGVDHTTMDDFDNMNTGLSTLMAGKMVFHTVWTGPDLPN